MIEDFLDFCFSAKRYKGLADSPVDARVLNGSINKIHKTIEDLGSPANFRGGAIRRACIV